MEALDTGLLTFSRDTGGDYLITMLLSCRGIVISGTLIFPSSTLYWSTKEWSDWRIDSLDLTVETLMIELVEMRWVFSRVIIYF